jgi:hypothetical protein
MRLSVMMRPGEGTSQKPARTIVANITWHHGRKIKWYIMNKNNMAPAWILDAYQYHKPSGLNSDYCTNFILVFSSIFQVTNSFNSQMVTQEKQLAKSYGSRADTRCLKPYHGPGGATHPRLLLTVKIRAHCKQYMANGSWIQIGL